MNTPELVPIEIWQTVATKLAIMVLQRDNDDPPAVLESAAYDLIASCVMTEMANR